MDKEPSDYLSEKEKKKLPHRGRGLKEFKNLVYDLIPQIKKRKSTPIRILEIGIGFGQLLCELLVLFEEKVDLYGINLEPKSLNLDKISRVAKHRGIIPTNYLITKDKIKLVICDAGEGIPFINNYFDLIISQMTFVYVYDKIKALEEVNRILKKTGVGLLWAGFENDDEAGYWSTLDIYDNNQLLNLTDYFNSFININYQMRKTGSTLKLSHDQNMKLKLKLKEINDLNHSLNPYYFGVKSIYQTS